MVTASSSLTRVPLLASLSNQVKTNFFEKCVSEYAKSAGIGVDTAYQGFSTDADFSLW